MYFANFPKLSGRAFSPDPILFINNLMIYFDFKIYFMFRASLYTEHQADPETKESEASEFEQNI